MGEKHPQNFEKSAGKKRKKKKAMGEKHPQNCEKNAGKKRNKEQKKHAFAVFLQG